MHYVFLSYFSSSFPSLAFALLRVICLYTQVKTDSDYLVLVLNVFKLTYYFGIAVVSWSKGTKEFRVEAKCFCD